MCFVREDAKKYKCLTFKDLYSLVGWLSDSVVSAVVSFIMRFEKTGFIKVSLLEALVI